MEGTDAMLRRAATLVNGRRMALVKVARRREHLLFDVPVVGLDTIPVMQETGTTVLAVEAGRTLMLDKEEMLEAANAAGIAIVGQDADAGFTQTQRREASAPNVLTLSRFVSPGSIEPHVTYDYPESPSSAPEPSARTTAAWSTNPSARNSPPSSISTPPAPPKPPPATRPSPSPTPANSPARSTPPSSPPPPPLHAEIGCYLLDAGIDVLVEKPIATDLASADRLIDAAARAGRILQVGHLERFNPAVLALEQRVTLPLFFEIHRMNLFSPRSLDVDVVLDLMIHDVDIVLALAGAEPEEIRAAGISILSGKVDIANVRLQFPNGCVANLTASRISTERVRKLRLFQPHQYLSLDYARQDLAVFSVGGDRQIGFEQAPVTKGEPLKLQFDAFLDSLASRSLPKSSGARRASNISGCSGDS